MVLYYPGMIKILENANNFENRDSVKTISVKIAPENIVDTNLHFNRNSCGCLCVLIERLIENRT